MPKEEQVERCTRTLAYRAGELIRAKEMEPGIYNLETIEPKMMPRISLENVPAIELTRIAREWCEMREIEYADD